MDKALRRAIPFWTWLMMFLWAQAAWSQLLTDDFPVSGSLTSNSWAQVGATVTNPILTGEPNLTYSGLTTSGFSASLTTTGQDVTRTFTAQTTGSVYFSCLVNVASAGSGDYFIHFGSNPFTARLFVRSATGGIQFGINKSGGSSGVAQYAPTVYAFSTTYLLVAKYTYNTGSNDDVASLFIEPVLGSAEPAPSVTEATGTDITSIGAINLRQGATANAAALRVDYIRVGTTWESVTAPLVVATPSLTATPATLTGPSGLTYTEGSGPASGTLSVSGTSLNTASGTITAVSSSTAFVVSPTTAPFSESALPPTTFTVQLAAGLTAGPYSATITFDGGGATANVPVSGTVLSSIPPELTATPNTLPAFAATQGGSASAPQVYTLTGSSLTGSVSVSASAGFQVSTDGSTFATTATVPAVSGAVSQTIAVRLAVSATAGTVNGTVSNVSGSVTANVAVSGSVSPINPVYYTLSGGPFQQDWSNAGLVTADDNWSGVPSIVGFRGDDLTTSTGTDPQTILADGSAVVDVIANQTNPNGNTAGGVAEFAIANPTVALQGSGTADAPHVVVYLNTTGITNATIAYTLRDIDGSADNTNQQVALQYRVGTTGNFTNIPLAYVADATTGPSTATLVTAVNVALPSAALNQPQVQLRIITSNAPGNDEWVGVDDIVITGSTTGVTPPTLSTTPTTLAGAQGPAYVAGSGPASVSLALSGSNLDPASGIVTVSSSNSTVFTVSADNSTFGASATIPYSNSTLTSAPVYVQLVAGQGLGVYTGTISFSGGGATLNVPVSGTVINSGSVTRIRDIQGIRHVSPLIGQAVSNVPGIVTALRGNGFYMQDPSPDNDDRTSEGIFVFQAATPTVPVGASVVVSGTVSEFRSGGSGGANNLTTTQISAPTVTVLSTGNALPAATILGNGGRAIPTQIIEDQAGDVETGGLTFDPATDGIDFYESLEGMRVGVNNPKTISPTLSANSIWVVADNGANATGLSARGSLTISASDFNPERILLFSGGNGSFPAISFAGIDVGASISSLTGIMDYFGGDYQILPDATVTITPSTLTKETSSLAPTTNQLTVATFNVENLDPGDGATKFSNIASRIVNNLQSPDIINLEEIQDNNGPTNNGVVDASTTFQTLISAITVAGGPTYQYRQIDPANGQDGGEPGGNIRVGFLFNPARVAFVDRAGGTATAAVSVNNVGGKPQLSFSPGRIDPTNSAFSSSRKPLVGEFVFNNQTVFVIANHFNSKGGDQGLFGRTQPPVLSSETQRNQQATIVRNFVSSVQAIDPTANIVVAGDLNDFQFSTPLTILKGSGATALTTLVETLPPAEQYTYNFGGNAQVLDHIMVSQPLVQKLDAYDVVHINAEFANQDSDHDPSVARFTLPPSLTATLTASATGVCVGSPLNFSVTVDGLTNAETYSYTISNGTNSTSATGISTSAVQTSLTPTVAGSYTLTVLSSTNASASATSGNVVLNALPTNASLTASSLTFCAGNTLTLTASATGGSSYTFSSGASQIGGSSGNTATVSQAGTYSVIVANASGCTATASLSVSVTPATSITAQPASASTVCVGGAVSMSVGAAGSGLTYQWFKGSQLLNGQTGAVLSLSNVQTGDGGSYYVVVTGLCGNPPTSNLFTLTVNPRPAAPALSGVSRQLNSSATPISLTQFVVATGNTLSFSGVNGLLNPPTATISTGGIQNFSVTQTDGNGCVSAATPFSLTVLQGTTATPPGDQTVCRGTTTVLSVTATGSGLRYQWFRNGTQPANRLIDVSSIQRGTQTASLTLVNVQTSGNYFCQITGTNGTAIVGPIRVTVNANCAGRLPAPETGTGLRVDVLANPLIDGQLRAIIWGVAGQRLRVQATNLSGHVLRQQQWEQAEAGQTIDWDWQARPSGTYLLQVVSDEQTKTIKLIKP